MTKREIHIKAVLKKKGYIFDPKPLVNTLCFNKYHWKSVEPGKRKSYIHTVFYLHTDTNKASLTIFTDFTIKSTSELEKYYIVYNRVKGDLEELGFKL